MPARSTSNEQRAQLAEHMPRIVEHVLRCVAANFVTPGVGLAIALTITLPSMTAAVVRVAVQFNRESEVRPAAVHPAPACEFVRDR